jgi:hypothetical protein
MSQTPADQLFVPVFGFSADACQAGRDLATVFSSQVANLLQIIFFQAWPALEGALK